MTAAYIGLGIIGAALFAIFGAMVWFDIRGWPTNGYQPNGEGEPIGPPPNQDTGGFK